MNDFYNEGVRFLIAKILDLKYMASASDDETVKLDEIVKILYDWDKFRVGK